MNETTGLARGVPGYWMNETSGVLRPAVEAYLLTGDELTPRDAAALRAYLRQWMASPLWIGPMTDVLRTQLDELQTRADFGRWFARADLEGIDPL